MVATLPGRAVPEAGAPRQLRQGAPSPGSWGAAPLPALGASPSAAAGSCPLLPSFPVPFVAAMEKENRFKLFMPPRLSAGQVSVGRSQVSAAEGGPPPSPAAPSGCGAVEAGHEGGKKALGPFLPWGHGDIFCLGECPCRAPSWRKHEHVGAGGAPELRLFLGIQRGWCRGNAVRSDFKAFCCRFPWKSLSLCFNCTSAVINPRVINWALRCSQWCRRLALTNDDRKCFVPAPSYANLTNYFSVSKLFMECVGIQTGVFWQRMDRAVYRTNFCDCKTL